MAIFYDILSILCAVGGILVYFRCYTSPGSMPIKHAGVFVLCLFFGLLSYPICLLFSKKQAFEDRTVKRIEKKLRS